MFWPFSVMNDRNPGPYRPTGKQQCSECVRLDSLWLHCAKQLDQKGPCYTSKCSLRDWRRNCSGILFILTKHSSAKCRHFSPCSFLSGMVWGGGGGRLAWEHWFVGHPVPSGSDCSVTIHREEMKALQAALQKQLDEATERAEKQQATVSEQPRNPGPQHTAAPAHHCSVHTVERPLHFS